MAAVSCVPVGCASFIGPARALPPENIFHDTVPDH